MSEAEAAAEFRAENSANDANTSFTASQVKSKSFITASWTTLPYTTGKN